MILNKVKKSSYSMSFIQKFCSQIVTVANTKRVAYFNWIYTIHYGKIYYSIKSVYWNENK